MGDVFKEQIVKKEPNIHDTLKKAGVIAATLILAVVAFSIPSINAFAPIIVVAVAFGAYYLFSFLNLEYEYTFTNGTLDIDVIYNKSRRKRIFTGDVKDFELMTHVDNKDRLQDYKSATTTLNCSSGVTKPNTYAFLTNYKDKKVKIVIEPNEMMSKAFATVLTPRKFIR